MLRKKIAQKLVHAKNLKVAKALKKLQKLQKKHKTNAQNCKINAKKKKVES